MGIINVVCAVLLYNGKNMDKVVCGGGQAWTAFQVSPLLLENSSILVALHFLVASWCSDLLWR
jgi:hypothetical protein